jgi:hypothetical protein
MAKKLDVDWGAFRALVVSGLSIREVARRLGISQSTALRKAQTQKWGITELRRPKQALACTERTVQAGKDFFREADGKTKFHLAKAVVKASKTFGDMPGEQIIESHQALTSVAKTASTVFRWDNDHPHPFLSIQGVMFSLSPDQLANAKDVSFDELREQYSVSHPVVREIPP